MTSSQPLPCAAPSDRVYGAHANPHLAGKLGEPLGFNPPSDFANLVFGQTAIRAHFPARQCPVTNGVLHVFVMGRPAQMIGVHARCIAAAMRGFKIGFRGLAMSQHANNAGSEMRAIVVPNSRITIRADQEWPLKAVLTFEGQSNFVDELPSLWSHTLPQSSRIAIAKEAPIVGWAIPHVSRRFVAVGYAADDPVILAAPDLPTPFYVTWVDAAFDAIMASRRKRLWRAIAVDLFAKIFPKGDLFPVDSYTRLVR